MPKFQGIFCLFLWSNMTKIVDFFAYVCYDYYDIVGEVSGLGKVIKKSPAFRAVEMLTGIDKITHKITHLGVCQHSGKSKRSALEGRHEWKKQKRM